MSNDIIKTIRFFVPGRPGGSGSKTFFKGRATPASKYQKPWQAAVSATAMALDFEVWDGPCILECYFLHPRPKGHRTKRGLLSSQATQHKTTMPDVHKLVRATEDALKGILFRDDSQIVRSTGNKRWGEPNGCFIKLELITETPIKGLERYDWKYDKQLNDIVLDYRI